MESSADELDLAIVNALQINSRASFRQIGAVLGVSAVTVARRWERLADEGIAWVTAYGGPLVWEQNCLAFMEVDTTASSTRMVADQLASDSYAASVEYTVGGANLFVTTAIADLNTLSTYVRDRVGMLEGVISTRVHLATRVYTEASMWRLDSLDESQRAALAPARPTTGPMPPLTAEDHKLLVALSIDGRMSNIELAREIDMSPATASRRLQRLVEADVVRFRCDIASSYTAWPVLVSYQAVCPPSDIDTVGRGLANTPEVRVAVAALGAANILFTVWLRSASMSLPLELDLKRRLPQLTITNRAVTLHSVKRFGRLLGEHGTATGVVPLDIWRPIPSDRTS